MRSNSNWGCASLKWAIYGIALAGAAIVAAPSFAGPTSTVREVAIVNGTHTAMVELQVKESLAETWQDDMLRHKSLGIQKRTVLALPAKGECFYDIKAMFEDGHRINKRHINLCKSPIYLLTDF
ncbi:MAG: hypothetical protein KGI68_04665 [Alphaproteobacteria bacterium]|nr:hypothetical protein [Alphaproteobacteria bacterium]MDE1987114.1 hypothetical protein [Alphaproteobacteria bacterium]MDE2163777.1 hypothetical protein [Alphaproteobacteria bacterium]MDE2266622.1 hypothetical protein [Alphaproteobacteria bacterium]